MRLQWWKESVAAIHSGRGVPEHPVAVALSAALRGSGMRSKRWLDQIVDARIRDAEMNGPPGNMEFLEAYAHGRAFPAQLQHLCCVGWDEVSGTKRLR